MTQTLATLIKVHKHKVDEQRRMVGQLEEVRVRLLEGLEALKTEMVNEKEVSAREPEAGRRWPDYISHALKREKDFGKQINAIEARLHAARDELQRRFAEQKKFEIAKQNYDAEQAAEQAREDRIEMDEIASVRDTRKDGN